MQHHVINIPRVVIMFGRIASACQVGDGMVGELMDTIVLGISVVAGPLLGRLDPIDRSMKLCFAPQVLP